jgi:CRP/FNR family cyclic AMP-dependent transcriptional regulator
MGVEPTELLEKVPIFSRFASAELELIGKRFTTREIDAGETLCREGDPGDNICFVTSGRLTVYRSTVSGDKVQINTLNIGQSFGEMALIENTPRSATVKAYTPSRLLVLDRIDFEAIITEHPAIGVKLYQGLALLLSRKLRQTSSRLVDYLVDRV